MERIGTARTLQVEIRCILLLNDGMLFICANISDPFGRVVLHGTGLKITLGAGLVLSLIQIHKY